MSIVKSFDSQIEPAMKKILKKDGEKDLIVFLDESHEMLGQVELPMSLAGIKEKAEGLNTKYLLLLYLMEEDPRILKVERANFALNLKQNLPGFPIIDLIICTPKKSNSFSQVIYF